jgi:hypothetical protein
MIGDPALLPSDNDWGKGGPISNQQLRYSKPVSNPWFVLMQPLLLRAARSTLRVLWLRQRCVNRGHGVGIPLSLRVKHELSTYSVTEEWHIECFET